MGQYERASQYQTRAFQLRDRVSERERFYIERMLEPQVWSMDSLKGPARLGLARAYAMTGDAAAAHGEYEKLLVQWKHADEGVRVIEEAREEYEVLRRGL